MRVLSSQGTVLARWMEVGGVQVVHNTAEGEGREEGRGHCQCKWGTLSGGGVRRGLLSV